MTRHEALRALLAQPDPDDLPRRGHTYGEGMDTPDPHKVSLSYVVRVLRSVLRRTA